ncbi:hypothetical protein [Bradyrhizobium sp.]|uniref:hypothetical protein n=1 Tax=Bradyrhizobium sp. TaxID=376 RepID=UPI0039E29376
MAVTKIYDLAVKVGEYKNTAGEMKPKYVNIGAEMQRDDGGKFLMLDAWFNPAAIPRKEGQTSILISKFEPRDNQGGSAERPQRQTQSNPPPRRQETQQQTAQDAGDDIPF